MVKHVGVDVAVSEDSGVVCAGCRALGKAAVSVSIRRSLLARWRARFSEEAAGMVIVAESGWECSTTVENVKRAGGGNRAIMLEIESYWSTIVENTCLWLKTRPHG